MADQDIFFDEYQDPDRHSFLSENEELKKRGLAMRFRLIRTQEDIFHSRRIHRKLTGGEQDDYGSICSYLITSMVWWNLRVPESFVQPLREDDPKSPRFGEVLYDDEGKAQTEPHPLAGQIAPITAEWFQRARETALDYTTVMAIFAEVMAAHLPEGEEDPDLLEFRAVNSDVAPATKPRRVRRRTKTEHAVPG